MMKLSTQTMESMTVQDVKEKLLKKYEKTHGGTSDRELIITKPSQGYGTCYFLTLDGSPPKGYGFQRIEDCICLVQMVRSLENIVCHKESLT
jgi:hypothetical protein